MLNFIPSTIPHNIFVIGAGGTGSRLMPMLAQFLRSITRGVTAQGWIENPNIWVIDDDVVEQKNILRQNFILQDVGKHKAAVVAERYSRAYGVNIIPMMLRVNQENSGQIYQNINDTLVSLVPGSHPNVHSILDSSIVIICVDSVEARRDILNTFITQNGNGHRQSGRTFFIDAGNEDNFGQVQFFTPDIVHGVEEYDNMRDDMKLPKLLPVTIDTNFIPMPVEFYRNLKDTPAQGSCADLDQTLAINAIMATQIMGVVQNYFYRKPMTYNTVSVSLNGGNFTVHNTFNEFKNRSIERKDVTNYSKGHIRSEEKNGKTKLLAFTGYCMYHSVNQIYLQLNEKLVQIKLEEERLRKAAELEAKKKAIAEQKAKEAELAKKKLQELREIAAKKEIADREATAAELAGLRGSARNSIAKAEASIADLPSLQPVARNRTRVELPVVPEAWEAPAVEPAPEPAPAPAPRRRTRASQAPHAAPQEVVEALMAVPVEPDSSSEDEAWDDGL